jgi:thioesterase domain-containing protein
VNAGPAETAPILTLQPGTAGPALVCVPPVSGSPYGYLPLAGSLDAEQPVYALEAPGYDGGGRPATSLPELSGRYTRALREARPHGAYCLLGWSMGGVVAYDMALRLTAAGVGVPLLILVDTAFPSALPPPAPGPARLRAFVTDLLAVSGLQQATIDAVLAAPPEPASPAEAFDRLVTAGIVPDGIDADFLLARYRVFEAHLDLLARYRISSTFPGRITLLRAGESRPELMCWQRAAAEVETHVVPGDHYSIWRGEGLGHLSHAVRLSLARVRSPAPGPA